MPLPMPKLVMTKASKRLTKFPQCDSQCHLLMTILVYASACILCCRSWTRVGSSLCMSYYYSFFRASGFTTRSDIGLHARDRLQKPLRKFESCVFRLY